MRTRRLGRVVRMMGGNLLAGDPRLAVSGASIHSGDSIGKLFFALPGRRCHGVQFAGAALRGGAAAVVVSRDRVRELRKQSSSFAGGVLAVPSATRALAALAAAVREEEADEIPAVAITGSVGKTTTCRYAAELLGDAPAVHRPRGSFNNHLGVPLTILSAPAPCRELICEVGSNASGEVHRLTSWVRPSTVVVTAVAPAHLDGFGDVETIEVEKLSILDALEEGGVGWIPTLLAVKHAAILRSCRRDVHTIGPGGDLEVSQQAGDAKRFVLHLRRLGRTLPFRWYAPFPHSPRNLEAALAVAISRGRDPEELLARVGELTLAPLRGEVRTYRGVEFLLDCYNANPASMESAIQRLEREPARGRRMCVLGTMEELGEQERDWHHLLGGRLAQSKLDSVFLMGRAQEWVASGLRSSSVRGAVLENTVLENDASSARLLADRLRPGDRVLFKASRAEALESFADRVARLLEGQEIVR